MSNDTATLILRGGRIWRGAWRGFREALAVNGGTVTAAGDWRDLEGLAGSETKIIDLAGRVVIPGFCDAHMHLLPLGLAQREVDVRPETTPDIAAIVHAVRRRVAATPPGGWVVGRGYDHFLTPEKRHPLREELDMAAPDNPVYLKRCCGHMGVANSAALRAAGIDEATPQSSGGHREMQNGRLTGLLQERAQETVYSAMPNASHEALIRGIEEGGRLLAAQGITSAMDAGVGMRAGFADMEAYQAAYKAGRLPVRTYLCLLGGPKGIVEEAHGKGLVTGVGDDYMKVGPVKIFTDGSAGGRTAAMHEPYLGEPENKGIFLFSDDEVNDMVLDVHAKGYQLAIHAIGDAAIDQTLAAVRGALEAAPAEGRRHRIEHCGFISPAQMAEMKRLGMMPAPQPVFMRQFGDAYVEVLGAERSASAYPMASWTKAGLHPAASTDSPVSDFNPFNNLRATMTRRTAGGRVLGPGECLDIETALTAMTWNGAYASFEEENRGTLDDGMLADMAVLSTDIFAAGPDEIAEAKADLTIIDGAVVHDRLGEVSA
ncbi:MAG: amidohydrolase [Alphaproteobacteria bacterium]